MTIKIGLSGDFFDLVKRRDLAGVPASYDENIVIHEASSLLGRGK